MYSVTTWRFQVRFITTGLKPGYLRHGLDLGTRSGLKKVHAHFPEMSKKLDSMYIAAQKKGNERLMGGIVGVWAKMCADSILRDKLFQEGAHRAMLDWSCSKKLCARAMSPCSPEWGVLGRG